MDWEGTKQVPWGILLLFGGGLTLASALGRHGVDRWVASGLDVLAGAPLLATLDRWLSVVPAAPGAGEWSLAAARRRKMKRLSE